jgi:hypothetical protein
MEKVDNNKKNTCLPFITDWCDPVAGLKKKEVSDYC